ncbi:hypothetical protein AgCh_025190 [Apium graveolens]
MWLLGWYNNAQEASVLNNAQDASSLAVVRSVAPRRGGVQKLWMWDSDEQNPSGKDEPTSGLDSSSSSLLLKALRHEVAEGVNVSMVEHQPSQYKYINSGSRFTTRSHWEKTLLMNEIMTGSVDTRGENPKVAVS